MIKNVINDRVSESDFCNKFFLLNAAIGRGSRSIELLIQEENLSSQTKSFFELTAECLNLKKNALVFVIQNKY